MYQATTFDLTVIPLLMLVERLSVKRTRAVAGGKNNWMDLFKFFLFPADVRTMIYTENVFEAQQAV